MGNLSELINQEKIEKFKIIIIELKGNITLTPDN